MQSHISNRLLRRRIWTLAPRQELKIAAFAMPDFGSTKKEMAVQNGLLPTSNANPTTIRILLSGVNGFTKLMLPIGQLGLDFSNMRALPMAIFVTDDAKKT